MTISVEDGRAAAGIGTGNGNDNYADMMIFDAVQSTVIVNDPLLRMTIDRATGQITLANNTGRTSTDQRLFTRFRCGCIN